MVADCHEYFVNDILVHNCIAWLLCYWFITRTKNLSNYGINTRDILSGNKVVNSKESVADRAYKAIQINLRKQLDVLTAQIKMERDNNVKFVLERQMRNIGGMIHDEAGEVFAIDDYINNLKEQKTRDKNAYRQKYMNARY